MSKKNSILLGIALATTGAGLTALVMKRPWQSPTPRASAPAQEVPASPPAKVVEVPAEPIAEPAATAEAMPDTGSLMNVAIGRGEYLIYQFQGDRYPLFTHALCSDGVVHPMSFVKIAPSMKEMGAHYSVEGLPSVKDICIVFRGYDPASIKSIKTPDFDPKCEQPFLSCAFEKWANCDESQRGDARFCAHVNIIQDLAARVETRTDLKSCSYKMALIYKGKEIILGQETGVFKTYENSKFQKINGCMWEGADGEYGDDQRFRDNQMSGKNHIFAYVFTIGEQPYFLYYLAGMEGDNWDIYELKEGSVKAVAESYFYFYR